MDPRDQRQQGPVKRGPHPTWPRVAVLVALLVLAFFAAKNCQDEQIAVSQDEAIEIASEQVDFEPEDTQIRLLRQGLDRRPFWVISLSIPLGDSPDPDFFKRLALVRIDAESGEVQSVQEQDPADAARAKEEVAEREAQAADQQEP